MIEQFYLTNRWDPNRLGQSGLESNGNVRLLHIPQSLGLKPPHQMQLSVILSTLHFYEKKIAVKGYLTKSRFTKNLFKIHNTYLVISQIS